jgi:hypothetical protein
MSRGRISVFFCMKRVIIDIFALFQAGKIVGGVLYDAFVIFYA